MCNQVEVAHYHSRGLRCLIIQWTWSSIRAQLWLSEALFIENIHTHTHTNIIKQTHKRSHTPCFSKIRPGEAAKARLGKKEEEEEERRVEGEGRRTDSSLLSTACLHTAASMTIMKTISKNMTQTSLGSSICNLKLLRRHLPSLSVNSTRIKEETLLLWCSV